MLILMKLEATKDEIESVKEKVRSLGFKPKLLERLKQLTPILQRSILDEHSVAVS